MGDTLALQVQNLATIVAGLVIAFTANVPMAAIILAVLPLVGLQGILQTKLYRGFSADAKVYSSSSNKFHIYGKLLLNYNHYDYCC